ncbi:ABC transporter substrate-binding protein [Xenophilus sp. Marseille-Q4582]|uniref:ABC transporter substrate-binding protein n=1 Tax=Xenophilus sp. Marseille-Q4582 TaxID=2866600 RepID=UPI001CE4754B|nr:helical backbone metal receptor [Xenophilus sp. Marseille-Q4582]
MNPSSTRAALRAAVLAAGLLGAVLPAGAQAVPAPLQITDDRGRAVRLAQPPQRIVTTLPSLTETVCELGACARLVGVDRYSNWPEAVRTLPQVGGGLDPNVEAIVALKPDLVLVAQSSRVADRLQALGLTVAVLEPKTHADVQRVAARVAQLLGLPAGDVQALWRRIDAAVEAAAQSVPRAAYGARVYVEVSGGPYAAGPGSFIGETLTRLHARNIVAPELGPFPKLNPEYVVRANPALIMVGARSAQGLEQRPGWSGIDAVKQARVCRFTADESDRVVRPGPRMAEGARLMAHCLSMMAAAPGGARR